MKLPTNYTTLSWQERRAVREEYVRIQKGNCCHCGNSLSGASTDNIMKTWINLSLFPLNFLRWPVHLHHDHTSGMTIGAVHCHCNAVLWQYHDQ